MTDIKTRLLVEGTRKREDILYCMRQLKNKKWTLKQYQHVMKKNIENLNRQATSRKVDLWQATLSNNDWLEINKTK